MQPIDNEAAIKPYYKMAAIFRRAHCSRLAYTVGGGDCGPAPSLLVATASRQHAWSMYWGDRAVLSDDVDMVMKASRLAEASRQSLLAAQELCAKEATAARETNKASPHEALLDALALPPRST